MASTNLPVQWTSFIGRTLELAEVKHLLAASRLVTIAGSGGCGKTRLAIQVAGAVKEQFSDGVWLVDLTSIRDPDLVPQVAAQALGLHLAPDQPALHQLLNWIEAKKVLLVLDNCEHLIDACAQLTQQLLSQSEAVHILATSRKPLAIHGEAVFPLAGLTHPNPGASWAHPQQDILQYEAVQFFVERVRAILPGFEITPENAFAVAEICRRLDGLPLALELASARANVLTPQQIQTRLSHRLDDRFNLLVSMRHGDVEMRHQTMSAAIGWSYDLLRESEQILLRRLSVFAGGCSLAAAETVCAGDGIDRRAVLDLLSSLANQSLLVVHTLNRSEARYSLLETIRQYAQEKLIASGEWIAIHDRHLSCYLALVEETAQKLTGPYQRVWLNWLVEEVENIRAALSWVLETIPLENGAPEEPMGIEREQKPAGQRIEAGLRVAIAIYQFWTIRDYVEEGLTWIERLLVRADDGISPVVRANAMAYAAFLAGFRGNTPAQMKYGQDAAAVAELAGEQGKPALKWALSAQAYGARAAGDLHTEFALEQRVIRLNRELGDRYQLGLTLSITSFSAMAIGQYDAAQAMLDESLPLLREAGNPYRIAMALNFSGDLARCQQNFTRAKKAYLESIALLRELGAPRDLASALQNLGHACLQLGEVERANDLFQEGLALQMVQQNTPGIAECLIGFAAMAIKCGLPAAGTRLLTTSVMSGGQPIVSTWAATRMAYEQSLALARANLTETEFEMEQAAGRALSLEQAVVYAQNLPIRALAVQRPWKNKDELSVREREVAELIAQGKANGEIADRLVVSKRTIEKHIAHILAKLGFTHRAEIVRWAIETGLLNTPG